MQKVHAPLADEVAETLYIPLYMRAIETGRPDAIIKDPKAVELVDRIDYDFSKFNSGRRSAIGVVIRVKHFDDKVQEFIQKHQNPVVVLIGCGLDTRYDRIADKRNAIFYELDLPEVIEIRDKLLPQGPNHISIAASMLETGWMDMLRKKHPDGDFIFVIEGVFMYFDEAVVKKVLVDLAKRFPGASINFDILNQWMSRNSSSHDTVKLTRATFKSGYDNDREFEKWSPKLQYVSTRLFCDGDEWKRIFWQGLLMKIIPKFRTAGRMLEYRVG